MIVLGRKWIGRGILGIVFGLEIVLAGSGVGARTVWREMATPHFRVIFPETMRESAQKVADIAEELLPQVEAFLQAHLDFQPAIVLSGDSDIPEGYTDPLRGAIHLTIAQPYEILSNGTAFGEWVRMVLAHELTHLVHLGAVGENLEWLRSLLGYVVLPNVIQPFWVWEGYAMYGEGMLTGRGVKNPFYAMVLRTQALSGGLLPHYLLRGYSFSRKWPGRLNVYIYGASLIEYIAQAFGEEKLAELSRRRSESISLFGFDRAVQDTLGISVEELWNRWRETVENQAYDDLKRVTAAGLSPVTECTSEGYATGGVALSPDGLHLVYALSHPDFRPGLRWKDLRTGEKELLVRGSIIGRPVFSPDGEKLVYAKIARDRKTSYGDLYLYDLKRKKEQRLTVRERAFSPVFWGEKILFLRRNRFPEGVFALDVESGVIQPVFEFDQD
ncbi:MAG: PD40 domain-containing protein, partial [Candidatus Atribacteria bacterium]|nr:PD40 domain-containing protein [Candidatus Atribacteria bacterium]